MAGDRAEDIPFTRFGNYRVSSEYLSLLLLLLLLSCLFIAVPYLGSGRGI